MSDALLLVRDRQAGWSGHAITHLLSEAEWKTHAALTRAGLALDIVGIAEAGEPSRPLETRLLVLADPAQEDLGAADRAMHPGRGRLMVLRGAAGWNKRHWLNRTRKLTLSGSRESFQVSGRSLYRTGHPLKRLFASSDSGSLRVEEGASIEARWGAGDGPAMTRREDRGRTRWDLGVPVDRLSPESLARLIRHVSERDRVGVVDPAAPPGPGAGATVLLLHDVEDALPEDPRGLESVRSGLEACLQSQARHGLRATYNLVGTFAQKIPDLVRRIRGEGHELASHGGSHRIIPELRAEEIQDEIEGAERSLSSICNCEIRGFRSPRSRWSDTLLDLLLKRNYIWNAEADPSPFPYRVPRGKERSLIRIPVAADDWDYVRHQASPAQVTRLWKREVDRAIELGCWVTLGSHPSVLGAATERLAAFEDFMGWLALKKVTVMTIGEGARWWQARIRDYPRGQDLQHELDSEEHASEHRSSRSL